MIAGNAHDLANLVGSLHPDDRIGRLVVEPGQGIGMLATDGLAGLQAIGEALSQDGNRRRHIARLAVRCIEHRRFHPFVSPWRWRGC